MFVYYDLSSEVTQYTWNDKSQYLLTVVYNELLLYRLKYKA